MPESFEEVAEVALEAVREEGRYADPAWIRMASLSTMVMALFSSVGGLLAGLAGNEAIIDRQKQLVDQVELNRLEIEHEVLATRVGVLESISQQPDAALLSRVEASIETLRELREEAAEFGAESEALFQIHELLAIGTTFLSIAITMTAMAVIVRQRRLWYFGMVLAAVGAVIVTRGVAAFFA